MSRRAATSRPARPRPEPAGPPPRRISGLLVAFGIAAIALVVVAGAVLAYTWYDANKAVLATVDGSAVSRDEYHARHAVTRWRLDYRESVLRAAEAAGRLDAETADIFLQFVDNARSSIDKDTIEGLIDARLQAKLAKELAIPPVTDSQVDDALLAEASTPEQRHVFVIGYRPAVDVVTGQPSAAEKAAARARAEQALSAVRAGADWSTLARESDDDYAANGGDAGFLSSASPQLDAPFTAAMSSLPAGGISDVVEGDDGEFRIGRVTEIVPPSVDPAFQQKIRDGGIDLDAYRAVVRSEALGRALEAKVVDGLITTAAPARRVSQIVVAAGTEPTVKVRHILVAPKDDPAAAPALPAADPAWGAAEESAKAIYQRLQADPSAFATLAAQHSDDPARPPGGELPFQARSAFDPAVAAVVFGADVAPDQVLAPIRTAVGWEVIQFIGRRATAEERMAALQTQAQAPGADFAALARANSDRDAAAAGDIGWVTRFQLDGFREAAIFDTPVGGVSGVFRLADGLYLFKVVAEEMRLPDAAQIPAIKANGFESWFADRRKQAAITRPYTTDPNGLPAAG